ncbi:hypothetical protein SAMN05444158_5360 [Bradyrhizobium canariense]|uniref:Uncharacterized protein n=1 Tax=Bradyrhizobium canariense TaxID=255045 RepID=A0A1H1ZD05_9BRAD|nr:hypothetical protein SAMN05444158_5360 [Bradyrhizobium canariense]
MVVAYVTKVLNWQQHRDAIRHVPLRVCSWIKVFLKR